MSRIARHLVQMISDLRRRPGSYSTMVISSLVTTAKQACAEGEQVLVALQQVVPGHLVRDAR